MVNRIKLILTQPEYVALLKTARRNLRTPDAQALYILRTELEQLGLLDKDVLEGGIYDEENNDAK